MNNRIAIRIDDKTKELVEAEGNMSEIIRKAVRQYVKIHRLKTAMKKVNSLKDKVINEDIRKELSSIYDTLHYYIYEIK